MKCLVIIATGVLLFAPLAAHGIYLTYVPGEVSFEIAAGAGAQFPLTVTMNDVLPGSLMCRLFFVNTVGDGSLPAGWITATPNFSFLTDQQTSGTAMISVQVPQGTPPGEFANALYSRVFCLQYGDASPGEGVSITVSVPPGCTGLPDVEITSFVPENIWPPRNTSVAVTISGRITLPGGCTLLDAGCFLDDEYGVYTSMKSVTVNADGSFTASFPVEARRSGGDDDGRRYTFTIFARDENGTGTSQILVTTVAHPSNK